MVCMHEAGHAVIGAEFGFPLLNIDIRFWNDQKYGFAGEGTVNLDKSKWVDATLDAIMMFYAGGNVAEWMALEHLGVPTDLVYAHTNRDGGAQDRLNALKGYHTVHGWDADRAMVDYKRQHGSARLILEKKLNRLYDVVDALMEHPCLDQPMLGGLLDCR